MNWDRVEFTNHEAYLEIARENLYFSQEIDANLNTKIGVSSLNYQGVSLLPDKATQLIHGLQLVNKSNIISVVFSALAAESFINYYALSKGKSRNYLGGFRSRNNLSDAVVKWIDIPHDITGQFALTEGSEEVNSLQKLFTIRNKLAHHKAKLHEIKILNFNNIRDPNSITIQDAKDGYYATVNAIRLIQIVSPDIDTSWLNFN